MTEKVCVPRPAWGSRSRVPLCTTPCTPPRRRPTRPEEKQTRAMDAVVSRGHIPTVDQLVEVIDHHIVDVRSGWGVQHADACLKNGLLQAVRLSEVGSSGKHSFRTPPV